MIRRSENMFSITDKAREQIKEMLKEESEASRLRFGIKGGGCSGLSYALGFDDEVNEDLDITDEINEIAVVMAKEDIGILENTEIDFKENMMGGDLLSIIQTLLCHVVVDHPLERMKQLVALRSVNKIKKQVAII